MFQTQYFKKIILQIGVQFYLVIIKKLYHILEIVVLLTIMLTKEEYFMFNIKVKFILVNVIFIKILLFMEE